MFKRLASFAQHFSVAMQRLADGVFERVRQVANKVSQPQDAQQTGSEPNNQQPARDFLHEIGEELKRQSELLGKGVGGAALETEEKLNQFADNIEKSNSLMHWVGRNLKAVAAIGTGAVVALLAGLHVTHFNGFDHPLVPPSNLARAEAEMDRLNRLNEITSLLDNLDISQQDSSGAWRNLEDLARPHSVPLPPKVQVRPELAPLRVYVTLDDRAVDPPKVTSITPSYENFVASYPTRESQSMINSELEKAAGIHVTVHLTGVRVPNSAPDWDQRHQPSATTNWHWEGITTTEVVPNK